MIRHLPMTSGARWTCVVAAAIGPALASVSGAAQSTDENPVYVDDSPRAWELFRQANDQARENPGEAARLYQELLDQYALKVIPRTDTEGGHFASVRSRVLASLIDKPDVLERYRQIQTAAAQTMLEQGEYEALWMTRRMTEPALEAALRLAQRDLEAARFTRALQLLREASGHPDLIGRRAAHRWLLLGIAANFLGDTPRRDEARMALADGADPESRKCYEEFMRLLKAGEVPTLVQGLNTLDVAPQARLEVLVSKPIWSAPLTDTLFSRKFRVPQTSSRSPQGNADIFRATGDWMTSVPTVAGNRVIINEGQVIRAFDRFSHREFWNTGFNRGETFILPRGADSVGDLNTVSVAGSLAVAVLGHATTQGRVGTPMVVCLDVNTGEARWTLQFQRLGESEEYEGLFPHGSVVIEDGMGYVLARKVTRQALLSTFVVAIDLYAAHDVDRVRWIRYLASSGSVRPADSRQFSTLTLRDGELYVASALGAVACLDARQGEVRWLQRTQGRQYAVTTSRPWEMTAPVISDRTVTAITPDQRFVAAFDRESGTELWRLPADAWNHPRYLLESRDRIVAVGDDVASIDPAQVDVPVWTLNAGRDRASRFDPRGRAQVAGDSLVIPTQAGLLVVDIDSGGIQTTLPMESAGLPLAYGEELYIAHSDRIEAFMPLSVAEARLREQLDADDRDPAPALSMLRLAAQSSDAKHAVDLALEAADRAIAASFASEDPQRAAALQEEVFRTLVDIANVHDDLTFDAGSVLHNRIATAAVSPDQRVEALIARGDWLTQLAANGDRARLADAIESYQQVLSSAELVGVERTYRDVTMPAEMVLSARLRDVLARFGASVYAPFAADAARRLDALTSETADSEALAQIAREFPFSDSAVRASLLASQSYAAKGQFARALAVLEAQVRRGTSSKEFGEALLGEIVSLCIERDWADVGRAWIRTARTQLRLTHLGSADARRPLDAWTNALSPDERGHVLVTFGGIDDADGRSVELIPGAIAPDYDDQTTTSTEYALIIDRNELKRFDMNGLHEAWSVPLGTSNFEVVYGDEREVLIWYVDSGTMTLLDATSGARLWESGELAISTAQIRPAGRIRGGASVMVGPAQDAKDAFQPLVSRLHKDLIVVGRSGGMRRFAHGERGFGESWQADHPLRAVHYIAASELGIALVGETDVAPGGRSVSIMVIVDPLTGAVRNRVNLPGGERPMWLITTPRGEALCGTVAGMVAVDLASGGPRWTYSGEDSKWQLRAWVVGDRVYVGDPLTSLHQVDLDTGEISAPYDPLIDESAQPELLTLRRDGENLLACYQTRLVWFDDEGMVVGQDSITNERFFSHFLPASDCVVVVGLLTVRNDSGRRAMGQRGQSYAHGVWVLSHNGRNDDFRTVESRHLAASAARLSQGWLMITDQTQTVAIPTRGKAP